MSRMKEKNLRRFVAVYIAGSIAFGGVAYAEEQESTRFLDGAAAVIDETVYSVAGGSFNASVDTANITINSNGEVETVQGGGIVKNGAQADVGQVTINVNGGTVVDLIVGGRVENGGTANITGKSTLEITNGIVENVTGGGSAESGNVSVKESEITIGGNSQIGFFQGGGDAQGDSATSHVDKATITINGGTIGIGLDGDDPNIGGGFATAAITQGQTNTSTAGDVTIKINNGTFKNSLYGGGAAYAVDEDLGRGQGSAAAHVENVNITIGGAAKTDGDDPAFYAGGLTREANTTSTVKNASITVKDTASLDEIYGGGDSYVGNTKVDKTEIRLQDQAKVNAIYGGGFSEAGLAEVVDAKISIQGDAAAGKVYGGGYGYSEGPLSSAKVTATEISIADHAKVGTVYGGGFSEGASASSAVENSTINISGGQIGSIYAGGADANSQVKNSIIKISGGKISGNISAEQNVTGNKALNFTQGAGSIVDGTISGYDTVTVKEGAQTTLTGASMAAGVSHGFTNLQVEQRGTLNISGGAFQADIQGAGHTKASALNFTAGKGSTIDGTITGFDTVTVANGAKTDWIKNDTIHTFGSLIVDEGGEINITGTAVTFDFAPVSPVAYALRAARAAQSGDFSINGAVNLTQGSVLTLKNGTVETGANGAFVSAVDQATLGNSGRLEWDSTANVSGDLHIDFTGISANKLENMGKTGEFEDLLNDIVGAPTSADGQPVTITNRNNPTSETAFAATLDQEGNISIVDMPRVSERGFSYYTSARQGNAYIAQNIVNSIHEHTAGLRNGEASDAFWAGIRGGSTDIDTRFGDAKVNTQFYQLGYDWDMSSNDRKAAVGFYFNKIAGDMKQNGVKNDLESAYDFGIYGTQELGGNNYLSIIGRYGHIGNSLRINDTAVDWKDKGYGLSLEFGNRHTQANGLMLEPYVQFNYHHLSSANFVSSMGTSVSMDSSALFDGKIGLRLIQQEANNANNIVYGGIAYTRGLSGDFSMKASQGAKLVEEDNDANTFALAIGMNRQISACSTVNLNAKKEFGDYDGWSVEGMLQVAF